MPLRSPPRRPILRRSSLPPRAVPSRARPGLRPRGALVWCGLLYLLGALVGAAWAQPVVRVQPSAEPEAEPIVLDLDTLLQRVRSDNPAVRIAQAKLADHEADFDRAYYAWVPQLKVDGLLAPLPERRLLRQCVLNDGGWALGGGNYLDEVGPCPGQNVQRDARLTGDTEIGILVRTSARLTFPLYTFGKIEAGQRAARAGVEVGRAGVELTRAQLELMVKQAYYGVQLTENTLDVLRDGRSRMQSARRDIEADLAKEGGRFTSNDLRMLLVQQADLDAGYYEAEALARTAWEGLRIAAGLEPDQAVALDQMAIEAVHIEPRVEAAYLKLALLSRPDVQLANAGVRARTEQVQMEKAQLYPDIALVSQFTYAKGTSADFNPDPFSYDQFNTLSWGVVLGAEWKLDFAAQIAKIRKAEASLAQTRAQRDALVQQLRLELSERVAQMERYQKETGVRLSAMKASKGWLVSSTLNFGLGLASTDELIRALTAYSKAQLSYFRSIYEYNLAVARLSQSVGAQLVVPRAPGQGPAKIDDDDDEG